MLIDNINDPSDIKSLTFLQMEQLAGETRKILLETVSTTGGHLASNLGVVELTLSLLRIFDVPNDKIIWDVGHQCYTYKLLTGRRNAFSSLRQQNGISGFPRSNESRFDSFISGHASTSIAVACGLKNAMILQNDPSSVIAVIGDGALTGGLAYEGLNNAGKCKENIIIILNDNEMAISKNQGALARYLFKIRTQPLYFESKHLARRILKHMPIVGKLIHNIISRTKHALKRIVYKATFFEELGFKYLGPIDGHNIRSMCSALSEAKSFDGPVFLHAITVKGKGYTGAEEQPERYHGVGQFNLEKGLTVECGENTFSSVFGCTLTKIAMSDNRVCAVTAAMEQGTGLQIFADTFKDKGRFFDVGIAEGFGVTFSAALAAGGCLPYFSVYSTFLQRGYDQIIHDAAIEKRRFILAIDRCGIVGEDGETHHGIFDAAFLSMIPNIAVYSPSNYNELRSMLKESVNTAGPMAIRYPRGVESIIISEYPCSGKSFDLIESDFENEVLLVTYGRTFAAAMGAKKHLGFDYSILKLNRIVPIENDALNAASGYKTVVFVEEGIKAGGIAEQFFARLSTLGYRGRCIVRAIEGFVEQGSVDFLLNKYGLDDIGIADLLKVIKQ
jgi:1-deoxy-D-xylulose-5-phosphate synthase